MKLAGRVALISGTGGGIGRAVPRAFVAEAPQWPAATSTRLRRRRLRFSRQNAGARAIARTCDVAKERDVKTAADAVHQIFGRLDILVTAAPHDPTGTVLQTSLADWERVLAVNLTGSFLLSRAALPRMIEGGGGAIVFIA